MRQVARNLTDAYDGFLTGSRYLIDDRDPMFTEAFRAILKDGGVRTVKLPTLKVHGRVQCRERLGGVLKYYYRRAA